MVSCVFLLFWHFSNFYRCINLPIFTMRKKCILFSHSQMIFLSFFRLTFLYICLFVRIVHFQLHAKHSCGRVKFLKWQQWNKKREKKTESRYIYTSFMVVCMSGNVHTLPSVLLWTTTHLMAEWKKTSKKCRKKLIVFFLNADICSRRLFWLLFFFSVIFLLCLAAHSG